MNEWRETLQAYERPRRGRSLLDLATSVVPYLLLWPAMVLALEVSYLLTLAIALPAAGFLVRSFIVFHDCTHGSFWPDRTVNNRIGAAVSLLVFVPFQAWKIEHALHHGTSGDLDHRGQGDVEVLTVDEYRERSWKGRLLYRITRNPFVMFGFGPIYSMILRPRFVTKNMRPPQKRSVRRTNVALLVLVTGMCLLLGPATYLMIQGPLVLLAGGTGVWLFFVQHQYEDVQWKRHEEWSFLDAALQGSSYLKLPRVLQFFTGNIGLHHVHHLSSRIPNYELERAHAEIPLFRDVPVLTFRKALRASRLKLWDERRGRLVTFREARTPPAASAAPRPA